MTIRKPTNQRVKTLKCEFEVPTLRVYLFFYYGNSI